MSLEYYLFCKEQYDEQIRNIDNILLSQDMIKEQQAKLGNLDKTLESYQMFFYAKRDEFLKKKERICKLKNMCSTLVQQHCNHDFVDDYIDITPERSEKITYCRICEYTK